ncbi:MAG TPA: hypothetical protein VFM05_13975 [Candidatus Saccharimonadales bacterium]|nr:hypothetical protein [Candidatus Saccharimonadales bacterium]
MFFSQKPNAILLVERETLSVYPKPESGALALPGEVFKYLEVQDKDKLVSMVAEYAKKAGMRSRRVLILLDKGVLLQKAVQLDGGSNTNTLITDFEHTLPFNMEDRHAVGLKQKDQLYLFGTNKAFYQLLAAALEKAGAKVYAVTPALVYGLTTPGKLTHTKLQQIYGATGLTHAANFLK